MHEASLTSAATVVIVVHGVGDHSRERILQQAKQGLQCQSGDAVQTMEVTIGGLPSIANESGHAPGMQFKIGSDTHYLVPVVWSRLRPRAANEAEMEERYPRSSFRVFDRLFQPLFYLFPSSLNTIRCIPVTKGILRRALALILAVCYAVVVPIARLSVVFFLSYLWVHRTELDKEHYLWWRILILLAIFWLLDWLVQKVNVVLDYVGDVVGYVGNQRHRQAAEERTLDVMRTVSKLAPQAQIVVAGHSLGSVLITHCVLRLEDGESLSRRLHILTMGSPLRVMSRFFPGKYRLLSRS